jgi:hypothetical protein
MIAMEKTPDDPGFISEPPSQDKRLKTVPKQIKFKLIKFKDLRLGAGPLYLIRRLFPREGLVVVYGTKKSGKSFWLLDVIMHIVRNLQYRGLRTIGGAFVYCYFEGQPGFAKRVAAYRQHHGIPDDDDIPLYLMPIRMDMIKEHMELIANIRAQLGNDVKLVGLGLDTLNRSLVGSESKDEDMGRYVAACDAIREAFACVVILVHHSGLEEGRPRGHTLLSGAADAQIVVTKNENVVTTVVELIKDDAPGLIITSELKEIDLGRDELGEPRTSLVITPGSNVAAGSNRRRPPSGEEKRLFDIISTALCDAPDIAEQDPDVPSGAKSVLRASLMQVCIRRGFLPNPDKITDETEKKKAASSNRALLSKHLNKLAGKSYIGLNDERVWITTP